MKKLGLLFVVVISLAFTVSCVSKEVQVTEPPTSSSETIEPLSDNTESSAELASPHPIIPEVKTPSELPSPTIKYKNDFSNPNCGFNDLQLDNARATCEDGEYHILVNDSDRFAWSYNISAGKFADFILEIDGRFASESKNGFYGMIFRTNDNNNFYYLYISRGGAYFVGERLAGRWRALRPWTSSEYIQKDFGTNNLRIVCKGSSIEVYINGHYLTTIDDLFDHFTSGYVGVIVYSPAGNTHVAFDNLKVYAAE
jgi:hypothetical protein